MRIASLLIFVLAAAQLGATDCGGNVTRDPGFDLWCGEVLCAWKVERGAIRRVATWHPDDAGVELLGDAAIEQFSPVDSADGTCIRFDLVSDVAENAEAALSIDVYGDGSVERQFPLLTTHWKATSYEFAVRAPYTGIRFEIAKRGPGRAVVARMHAVLVKDAGGCAGLTPLDGGAAPLGAICSDDSQCASRICQPVIFGSFCAGCDLSAPACAAGQVCGRADPGPPERAVPIACVPAAGHVLGEQCIVDAECDTGLCNSGRCSTCNDQRGAPCPGGLACAVAVLPGGRAGPHQCAPGQLLGKPGDPCTSHADCASRVCNGDARRECLDNRECATDANCPVDANLKPGPCLDAGFQGGSCG